MWVTPFHELHLEPSGKGRASRAPAQMSQFTVFCPCYGCNVTASSYRCLDLPTTISCNLEFWAQCIRSLRVDFVWAFYPINKNEKKTLAVGEMQIKTIPRVLFLQAEQERSYQQLFEEGGWARGSLLLSLNYWLLAESKKGDPCL